MERELIGTNDTFVASTSNSRGTLFCVEPLTSGEASEGLFLLSGSKTYKEGGGSCPRIYGQDKGHPEHIHDLRLRDGKRSSWKGEAGNLGLQVGVWRIL